MLLKIPAHQDSLAICERKFWLSPGEVLPMKLDINVKLLIVFPAATSSDIPWNLKGFSSYSHENKVYIR